MRSISKREKRKKDKKGVKGGTKEKRRLADTVSQCLVPPHKHTHTTNYYTIHTTTNQQKKKNKTVCRIKKKSITLFQMGLG